MNRKLCLLVLTCLTASIAAFAPAPVYREPKTKTITNSIGMKLAHIPAGEFPMGSTEGELRRILKIAKVEVSDDFDWAETPQRKVKITKAFYMGVYEVTQGEYEKVMGTNPSYFSSGGDGEKDAKRMDTSRFPVERVSWEDAVEFCKKLSQRAAEKGRTYRLPTEAEWEYACRAGTKTITSFGDSLSSTQANFNGTLPFGSAKKGVYLRRTCKVGSYVPNAWGLHDMYGNVREFCSDWYGKNHYAEEYKSDPRGPSSGHERVSRGGSWIEPGISCRSAVRGTCTIDSRLDICGFRFVCEMAP